MCSRGVLVFVVLSCVVDCSGGLFRFRQALGFGFWLLAFLNRRAESNECFAAVHLFLHQCLSGTISSSLVQQHHEQISFILHNIMRQYHLSYTTYTFQKRLVVLRHEKESYCEFYTNKTYACYPQHKQSVFETSHFVLAHKSLYFLVLSRIPHNKLVSEPLG